MLIPDHDCDVFRRNVGNNPEAQPVRAWPAHAHLDAWIGAEQLVHDVDFVTRRLQNRCYVLNAGNDLGQE